MWEEWETRKSKRMDSHIEKYHCSFSFPILLSSEVLTLKFLVPITLPFSQALASCHLIQRFISTHHGHPLNYNWKFSQDSVLYHKSGLSLGRLMINKFGRPVMPEKGTWIWVIIHWHHYFNIEVVVIVVVIAQNSTKQTIKLK